MAEINPMRQRLIDYLAGFGLDANEMIRDDWDEYGFHLCRPGADWETLHPWPEGFDVRWLGQLAQAADREDYRLAGLQV